MDSVNLHARCCISLKKYVLGVKDVAELDSSAAFMETFPEPPGREHG